MKILLLQTLLLITQPLYSQDDNDRIATVKIVCISFAGKHNIVSVPAKSKGWTDTHLSIRYPSDPVKASLPGNILRLYAPDQRPTPDNPAKPLASVRIPTTDDQFIILLLPSGKEQPAYRGVAIPLKEFRFGGLCMLNVLKKPVAMTIDGKSKNIITPGNTKILNPAVNGKNRVALVKFYSPKSNKPFYSANWNLRKDIREIHIMFPNPKTGRPKIKTIVDVKPGPKKPS